MVGYRTTLIAVCCILTGCLGSDGDNVTYSVTNQTPLTEESLTNVTKNIASDVIYTELSIDDELDEGEVVTTSSITTPEPEALVALRSVVGDKSVGGYACNVISSPGGEYSWSINLYNLNDSLDSGRTIFGVTSNRTIQSVACTPDGSQALFSIKDSPRGDYEVYFLDLVTNEITQLTNNDTDDVDVSMNVDGLVMAWQNRLADGRQAITIRTYEEGKATFSPDRHC